MWGYDNDLPALAQLLEYRYVSVVYLVFGSCNYIVIAHCCMKCGIPCVLAALKSKVVMLLLKCCSRYNITQQW